jgi:3-hydroxybutyryl-CoA dehydratase
MAEYKNKGYYFEDLQVGQEFVTARRTILDADVINFACLTGDFNPIHIDDVAAAQGPFGKRIAHGSLGVAIMNGQQNQLGIFEGTTIAKLEETNKFLRPIHINDTIHTEMKVVAVKPSSKGGRGIVSLQVNIINQKGEVVTESTCAIMVKSRK